MSRVCKCHYNCAMLQRRKRRFRYWIPLVARALRGTLQLPDGAVFVLPMGSKSHDSPQLSRPLTRVPQRWRYRRFLNRLPRHPSCPSTRSRFSKKGAHLCWIYCIPLRKNVEDVSEWSTGPCETSNVVEGRRGKCHRSFTTLRFLTEKGGDQGARRVHLAPLCTWNMRPVYEVRLCEYQH
jgi:hypothetical protein